MPLNNRTRALKATLYSTYLDFKSMYEIIIEIMFGFIISQITLAILVKSGTTSSNTSALNTGFMIALWAIPISIMVISSNTEMIKKFSFPVDRKTLALSHLIYIFLSPFAILLASCGIYLLEYLLYSVTETAIPGFVYLWLTTKGSFFTGFCLSYFIIVLVSSGTYFLFMYFYRYKIVTSVLVGIFMVLLLTSIPIRMFVMNLGTHLLFYDNPLYLCAVYLGLSLVLWGLGYIPLKRMEAKK